MTVLLYVAHFVPFRRCQHVCPFNIRADRKTKEQPGRNDYIYLTQARDQRIFEFHRAPLGPHPVCMLQLSSSGVAGAAASCNTHSQQPRRTIDSWQLSFCLLIKKVSSGFNMNPSSLSFTSQQQLLRATTREIKSPNQILSYEQSISRPFPRHCRRTRECRGRGLARSTIT